VTGLETTYQRNALQTTLNEKAANSQSKPVKPLSIQHGSYLQKNIFTSDNIRGFT